MTERWYTAADLAELSAPDLPTAKWRITVKAQREAWPSRPRKQRGGTAQEYPLSALPAGVQAHLARLAVEAAQGGQGPSPAQGGQGPSPAQAETDALPDTPARTRKAPRSEAEIASLMAVYEAKPQKQKDEAAHRLAMVQAYHAARRAGHAAGVALKAAGGRFGVSASTLRRYVEDAARVPADKALYALVPEYAGRTVRAEFDLDAQEWLKADWLRAEAPSKSGSIYRLRRVAAAQGWAIPKKRTLERFLDAIPRAVRLLAREGKDALLAAYPAQVRDKTALEALQWINADGYRHNVFVRFPDGEIRRPKTWVWQDVYSSKILAWRTDKEEHTDLIRLSFSDLLERYGLNAGGTHILLDNTMAAANKAMSGGAKTRFRFKVKDDDALGVFTLLVGPQNIHWATPRWGQAKPVERVFGKGGFGEVVDKHPQFAGAYTGRDPLAKPENYASRAIDFDIFQRVLADEIPAFNALAGRRGAMHQGRSFDALFEESYAKIVVSRTTEAQRRLLLLTSEALPASAKDGTLTLEAGRAIGERQRGSNRYWSPIMNEHAGRKVVARFDPQRLHEGVHVYSLDGRYICFAECVAPEGFADQNAGREHTRERNIFKRATKTQLEATRRMEQLQAARYMSAADSPISPVINPIAPKVVAVKFGDPRALTRDAMRRPAAPAVPPEEAARLKAEQAAFMAEQSAEKDEIERNVDMLDGPDFWGRFRLAQRLQKREARGEALTAREAGWLAEYMATPEYSENLEMHLRNSA